MNATLDVAEQSILLTSHLAPVCPPSLHLHCLHQRVLRRPRDDVCGNCRVMSVALASPICAIKKRAQRPISGGLNLRTSRDSLAQTGRNSMVRHLHLKLRADSVIW